MRVWQVGGTKTESCRQTIKLLTANPVSAVARALRRPPPLTHAPNRRQGVHLIDSLAQSSAQLRIFSKVVHGGWMHKLGEGLGGWTTRYFTLT